ncbi:DegT/DnrJ/EryC1/StrS family aminotransferase [Anaerobacillus isosaccharinicus]|uniref:DegT/DnrJ/EryC1/StrS family aminotransferase n=1 Tax=Anaerobacillus isosaccharinicus TaxID=1532552 RepID=A0A1S2M7W5_9BACI|nr:DegT/DnrJ/EryC1/StrS family aminotransferase [Anaerobacillus isosaccharinicus]MBA5587609.1 DegT/DnrJ/EryC1/StrS family aminotransferase [Anaerobacillus isosaccharinicus]QOY34214.1 DegT/DnrJ/EryC1/StrS family aminotransferase [Anaerobacillus isosaccharinicus]
MIPLINLKQQFASIKLDILKEIEEVIESGNYILGPKVKLLEETIASKLHTKHAVAVANGTDALVLTLDAYGIGTGDEVITTPFTFFATAEAISRVNAVPVFVDVEEDTCNIDPTKIEQAITPKTKAILPVHLFGHPANMDDILSIAKRHNLIVIEDACQAFGAKYHDKYAGNLGDAACFSFFPTKNLGTLGDGGIVTTNDDAIAEKIRKLRTHGSDKKYYHSMIGYNSRLDEIHAAILLVALKKIDEWNNKRISLASNYTEALRDIPSLSLPACKEGTVHIYHLYCVSSTNRDNDMKKLKDSHISSAVYYPKCLHLQEVYKHLGYKKGSLPVAEFLASSMFALPMSPFLTDEEQRAVISVISQLMGDDV